MHALTCLTECPGWGCQCSCHPCFDMPAMFIENGQSVVTLDNGGKEEAPAVREHPEARATTDQSTERNAVTAFNPTGSWLVRLDGCPTECGNAELPYGLVHTPNSGDLCLYKCTSCGHRWHCSWVKEASA